MYHAARARFANFEGIFGFFYSVNHLSGGGVITTSACDSYETGERILRTEHAYKVEATSMSREELLPELSLGSEYVENLGLHLLSLHNTDSKQLVCETDSRNFLGSSGITVSQKNRNFE